MPQIIIEHRIAFDNYRMVEELIDKMSKLCANLFGGHDELDRIDFGFKFEQVIFPSTSTHDVIIRIHLHAYPIRLMNAEADATMIRDLVIHVLNGHGYYLGGASEPTVGVSLSYGEVAWTSGTYTDLGDNSLDRVFRAMAPRPAQRHPSSTASLGGGISGGGGTGIED